MSSNIRETRDMILQIKQAAAEAEPRITGLNRALRRYVALSRRAGFPPYIMDLIAKAQQGKIAVDTLTRSIQYFYTVSGPIGWLLGIGGLALTGFMVADMMELGRPQY